MRNLFVALALSACIASPAMAQSVVGANVTFSHLGQSGISSPSTETVVNGTSDTVLFDFGNAAGYTANLDANSLTVDFSGTTTTFCLPRSGPCSTVDDNVFAKGSVGLVLSSPTFDFASLISGLAITNTGNFGFTNDRVSAYGTNGILFNFGGLSYNDASGFTATFAVPQTAAVPEPATWAMMLLGFGGIGFQMRRSRKLVLAQAA